MLEKNENKQKMHEMAYLKRHKHLFKTELRVLSAYNRSSALVNSLPFITIRVVLTLYSEVSVFILLNFNLPV